MKLDYLHCTCFWRGTNNRLTGQDIRLLFENLKNHFCVHNSPPLIRSAYTEPDQTVSYLRFLSLYGALYFILTSTPRPLKQSPLSFPAEELYVF